MKKIIFLIGPILYGLFAFSQLNSAIEAEEGVPTTVFRVSGAEKQICWIGAQHSLDWGSVEPAVKCFLEDLGRQPNTYFVGERNVDGSKDEVEKVVTGYANLALYEGDLNHSEYYTRWKDLQFSEEVDALFVKVSQQHGEDLAFALKEMTSDSSNNSWLHGAHPLLVQEYIEDLLDDFAQTYNGDQTMVTPMDERVKELFQGKTPLYLEELSDIVAAYVPEEHLKDCKKFEAAVQWFCDGCPYIPSSPSARTEHPVMQLIARYPFLELQEDAATRKRNISWKKNLSIFMQQRSGDILVGTVGAWHLGGETGVLNASYQLLLEQCGEEDTPTIEQLWSDGVWRPLHYESKLFDSLPPSASQEERDLLEEMKRLFSPNQ